MSVTISGLILSLLSYGLRQAGVPYVETELEQILTGLGQVVGLGIAWYGRVRKGDVNVVGLKK